MSDRRLPPLSALRAFELAARQRSFTQAAARLGVSQSSVTRQMATLEANLGAQLFRRGRRGVELTPEGDAYFREVAPAFELIAAATTRLRQSGDQDLLRVRVYPTFAAKWLIPRLARFQAWAPSVRFELDTDVAPVDFTRSPLDAAIQFGRGDRADVLTEFLIADEIEPVCSPALLAGAKPPLDLDEMMRLPLLHARYRRGDWADWAAASGRPDLAELPGLELSSSMLAYQAAEQGLGVAMGQAGLLTDSFARGALMRMFERPLRRSLAYHLLTPGDREPPLRVRAFRAWLRSELAA
jgi:LysR family transcriptional regulator, glycine cleavage system transcriptional activator